MALSGPPVYFPVCLFLLFCFFCLYVILFVFCWSCNPSALAATMNRLVTLTMPLRTGSHFIQKSLSPLHVTWLKTEYAVIRLIFPTGTKTDKSGACGGGEWLLISCFSTIAMSGLLVVQICYSSLVRSHHTTSRAPLVVL